MGHAFVDWIDLIVRGGKPTAQALPGPARGRGGWGAIHLDLGAAPGVGFGLALLSHAPGQTGHVSSRSLVNTLAVAEFRASNHC